MMWWRDQPFTLGGSGRAHLKVQGLSAGYGPLSSAPMAPARPPC